MRLNNGLPVWHASVSAQARGQFVHVPDLTERWAVRLLVGVGGDREWWWYNPLARVGHLRVALTVPEYESMPSGCAISDAGEAGPERPRTRR
jgi:hypothetical protein